MGVGIFPINSHKIWKTLCIRLQKDHKITTKEDISGDCIVITSARTVLWSRCAAATDLEGP